jgi:hypothetical protein
VRHLIAVVSVLGMLFGLVGLCGFVWAGHDFGTIFFITGAICFAVTVGANDIVDAIKEATKAIDDLRKMNDKKQP